MTEMITIKEMANMLHISTTTVSNVINGKTGEVSKATVAKVERLMNEYNYVPNINAKNLASNQSRIIGFAMKARPDKYKNVMKDPFTAELIGVIEQSVRARGYFMMIYISDNISEIIKYVSSWNADGLILLGLTVEDSILVGRKLKKPKVCIDSYLMEDVMEIANVGLADKKGGYLMTSYLIGMGHKKIAFISDNFYGVDHHRYIGYREALKEAGIGYGESDYILLRLESSELNDCLQGIYEASEEYTAFFCTSDYYAVMLMNYLRDRGKHIPDDISIVGFDDNDYSKIVRPALTTVHQNVEEKGEIAVENLISQMQGNSAVNKQVTLPVSIVVRDTVKDLTNI